MMAEVVTVSLESNQSRLEQDGRLQKRCLQGGDNVGTNLRGTKKISERHVTVATNKQKKWQLFIVEKRKTVQKRSRKKL